MPHYQTQEAPLGAPRFPSSSRPSHRLQIKREQLPNSNPYHSSRSGAERENSEYEHVPAPHSNRDEFSDRCQPRDTFDYESNLARMSSPSQVPKGPRLDLDARAAELKEKLVKGLKSQTQTQPSTSTASSSPSTSSSQVPGLSMGAFSNANPTQAIKASSSGGARVPGLSIVTAPNPQPSHRRAAKSSPTNFVPHPIPQQQPKTSVPASANDIAALIDSISSNIRERGKHHIADSQVNPSEPTIQQSTSGSQPPQEDGKSLCQISRQSTGNATAIPGIANTPTSSREEGEVSSGEKAAKKPPSVQRAPSSQEKPATSQPRLSTEFKVKGSASASPVLPKPQDGLSEQITRSDFELNREKRRTGEPAVRNSTQGPKPVKANNKANSGGNGNNNEIVNRDNQANRTKTTTDPTPVKATLASIIDQDPDLRDWLVLTDYYNIESRNRKLERHRKVKALAAEKERIEEEQRKLMEEEEMEMGIRPFAASAPVETPLLTPVSGSNSASNLSATEPKLATESSEGPRLNPAKRVHNPDPEDPEPRPEKIQRKEEEPAPEQRPPVKPPSSPYRGSRRAVEDRPYSPPPRRDHSPRRSPQRPAFPQGPRFRDERHDEFHDRRQYDSYKGDGARHGSPPPRGRLDLGHYGQTRFFIVKSFNEENVRKCMQDGVWATQSKNGQVLTSAFANCKNVILFFSINKSRAFQGYARMSTAPSPDTPRPKWMNGIHWDTSPPFRVEWLSKVAIEFSRVGHLKNRYNDNLAVLVGKDGQEIEEDCGARLLYMMDSIAGGSEKPYNSGMSPGGPASRRGGYGGGRGGGFRRERDFRDRESEGMRIKGFAGVKKEDEGW